MNTTLKKTGLLPAILLLPIFFWLSSCGEEQPDRIDKPTQNPFGGGAVVAGGSGDQNPGSGNGSGGSDDGEDEGEDDNKSSGDLEPEEDDDDFSEVEDPEEGEDLASMCGIPSLDSPSDVILSVAATTPDIVTEGRVGWVRYRVVVRGYLSIDSSILSNQISTSFDVIEANSSIARTRAEETVAQFTGDTLVDFLSVDDRISLYTSNDSWTGNVCTIQPGRQITTTTGGYRTVVEFDPPIPSSISPKAPGERYSIELEDERNFEDITATIIETDNPLLTAGDVYTGTFAVATVPASASIDTEDGTVEIAADFAAALDVDFGSADLTNAMGLKPRTVYYINHDTRTFDAIYADPQIEDRDPVWYFNNELTP